MFKLDKNYNSLDRITEWDKNSQNVITDRIKNEIGTELKFSFLTSEEGNLLKLITDTLIIQADSKKYIKIAEAIDRSLSQKKVGVRFGDNPWRGKFYKKGLGEILSRFESAFDKKRVEKFIEEIFKKDQDDLISNLIRQILDDSIVIFYSHPGSWNQIGFPGPAYPEGYAYLGCNETDEWEPKYKIQ